MSYSRLLELEELFVLAEQADGGLLLEGINITDEVAIRQQRLARLAEAKAV